MCACVVLVVGMVAAVNLAVPMPAASALNPSAPALVWIVDTYVIVFACLVIPGGAAGDRFGRKGVLLAVLLHAVPAGRKNATIATLGLDDRHRRSGLGMTAAGRSCPADRGAGCSPPPGAACSSSPGSPAPACCSSVAGCSDCLRAAPGRRTPCTPRGSW
jgi:MFS family permease